MESYIQTNKTNQLVDNLEDKETFIDYIHQKYNTPLRSNQQGDQQNNNTSVVNIIDTIIATPIDQRTDADKNALKKAALKYINECDDFEDLDDDILADILAKVIELKKKSLDKVKKQGMKDAKKKWYEYLTLIQFSATYHKGKKRSFTELLTDDEEEEEKEEKEDDNEST